MKRKKPSSGTRSMDGMFQRAAKLPNTSGGAAVPAPAVYQGGLSNGWAWCWLNSVTQFLLACYMWRSANGAPEVCAPGEESDFYMNAFAKVRDARIRRIEVTGGEVTELRSSVGPLFLKPIGGRHLCVDDVLRCVIVPIFTLLA